MGGRWGRSPRSSSSAPRSARPSSGRSSSACWAAIASAPQSAAAVQKAVADAGEHSAKAGFTAAMKITLWVEVGLLGLTFLATFLLPEHARPEEETV